MSWLVTYHLRDPQSKEALGKENILLVNTAPHPAVWAAEYSARLGSRVQHSEVVILFFHEIPRPVVRRVRESGRFTVFESWPVEGAAELP